MFKKVLIANRGAIAVRIIRTLKQLGITSVAVYADADRDSLHASHADEAYSLGEGSAVDTYLDQEKLLGIMSAASIDAVHPGYGFLSENAEFCEACESRGITFIGPTPEQMRLFGLKHTARDAAQQSNVPLLPGTDLVQSQYEAKAAAMNIGLPVIVKSTAGGGGIGMQVCREESEVEQAFASVQRLSASNFSNDGVFIEKYVDQARHIEVQIFGDGAGQALALGERDCSAQRRNQKVIEETPAPGLSQQLRDNLHRTAVELMQSVCYRGAGTVEFILDAQTDQFYFLEVNTRLQVEHGVTEQVYGVDLVAWMLQLAAGELEPLSGLSQSIKPSGHSIQVRVYAEDPNKNFQPSAGLLTTVDFPEFDGKRLRIDHWLTTGINISTLYDPMLAKMISHAETRDEAITQLIAALASTSIEGIETNCSYCKAVLADSTFTAGKIDTRYLNQFSWQPQTIDILSSGTMTSVQDYPGRVGYWDVGVPPSGPFDDYSFQLGNRLLGNPASAAGLEITLNGPTIRFNCPTRIVLTGAAMAATLDGQPLEFWQPLSVNPGQTLKLGQVDAAGTRSYLLISGGIQCQPYLGSRATFTLGQFGGHGGRALRPGDVLHITSEAPSDSSKLNLQPLLEEARPAIGNQWSLRAIYGPHGAPDYFTEDDIATFFSSTWKVHYNSSRTGIRLVGPKPNWARSDGGEAGMHPSNIHDNAYAIGTVDFTGDMPVILGPDGPSLGGFVCPATVIGADLWKLGQLKAGDEVSFVPVSQESARQLAAARQQALLNLGVEKTSVTRCQLTTPVIQRVEGAVPVVYRPSGDRYLLVEYGAQTLDIRLRFRAHALMLKLQSMGAPGILELTPGIRSLQLHYDPDVISLSALLEVLKNTEQELQSTSDGDALEVPSRIVHLPLSWDDDACQIAVQKYQDSVRQDAPWCPDNIEFIRRINGLDSVQAVKETVFNASYVVMGLGDVYLGAPVATPLDPRHRLVTTKYNPARTWTAENSVGIGGAYLCVYGMEGPGGYQLIGRTLQMWNRYQSTPDFEKPWLLRFFDQIRFYPVSSEELIEIRSNFPSGRHKLNIEETTFNLAEYEAFLTENHEDIANFTNARDTAFQQELQQWIESGAINFSAIEEANEQPTQQPLPDGCVAVETTVSGNVWKLCVEEDQQVLAGQTVCILESMKMEIEITAPVSGSVMSVLQQPGTQVQAGQQLMVLNEKSEANNPQESSIHE